MRSLRAIAQQSPAIVISVIALTFSLGSGAGYAASVAVSHPAARITWHNLGLKNGWHGAPFRGTGKPAYTVIDGVVYLTGSADRSNNPSVLPVLAVLPRSARPRHDITFAIFSSAALTPAWAEVSPNGEVFISGADASSNTSLAGITFPLGS
jgi:hypothetical protein